jgi:hypothetical protein
MLPRIGGPLNLIVWLRNIFINLYILTLYPFAYKNGPPQSSSSMDGPAPPHQKMFFSMIFIIPCYPFIHLIIRLLPFSPWNSWSTRWQLSTRYNDRVPRTHPTFCIISQRIFRGYWSRYMWMHSSSFREMTSFYFCVRRFLHRPLSYPAVVSLLPRSHLCSE